jgi:hypothetical protein
MREARYFSCIYVLEVSNFPLSMSFIFMKWAALYLCVRRIAFHSFYDFYIYEVSALYLCVRSIEFPSFYEFYIDEVSGPVFMCWKYRISLFLWVFYLWSEPPCIYVSEVSSFPLSMSFIFMKWAALYLCVRRIAFHSYHSSNIQ